MAHIVIIGAGTGGLPLAYEMRAELGRQHRVTVINAHSTFSFVPSNPWVGVGWRKREDISFEIAPRLARKDIAFIHDTVTEIAASENRLSLEGGRTVNYDYLVVATGPKLAFEKYFLCKMKSGVAEPFYERLAMGLMGVNRIKNKPLVDPEEAPKT